MQLEAVCEYDAPEAWTVDIACPWSRDRVTRYQDLIDRLVGTSRGQPIIKLVWMPEVMGWRPHQVGMKPFGYTYPVWTAIWDSHGKEVAPPRWGLMERCEPEQYVPSWITSRYQRLGGSRHYEVGKGWIEQEGALYDVKGPVPDPSVGHYTKSHRHVVHRDSCCQYEGNEVVCWGYYVEPNEDLLTWIGEHAYISRNDKEIQPRTPVDQLPNSNAQLAVKDRLDKEKMHTPEELSEKDIPRISPLMMPKGSFVKSQSGLYLPEN